VVAKALKAEGVEVRHERVAALALLRSIAESVQGRI